MNRIYRAGASSDIVRAESDIAKLKKAGWTITFDWTVEVRKAGGNASPDDLKVRREAAIADLNGVAIANVLWLAQPDGSSTSTGAWVELGYALAMRETSINRRAHLARVPIESLVPLPVIVVSGSSRKCIFSDLCDARFESHDDALEFIIKDLKI
jgi:hypothetical protein